MVALLHQMKRLDQVVHELYPDRSRTSIQKLILEGAVRINNVVCRKPGRFISINDNVHVNYSEDMFVSRAGLKLDHILTITNLDLRGLVALDAGLSTGVFSDCLLQRGVQRVYGIDVGYGQVHEKIKRNPRLVLMERTHLNEVIKLPELVDIATIDLSFISVTKCIPTLVRLMHPLGHLIVLVKPQFELQRHYVGRGGIVRDPAAHRAAQQRVVDALLEAGFTVQCMVESPIEGSMGNKEFLGHFIKTVNQDACT